MPHVTGAIVSGGHVPWFVVLMTIVIVVVLTVLVVAAFALFSGLVRQRAHARAVEAEERSRLLTRAQEARGQAELAQRRLELLSKASDVLASSLDYPTTLATVARLATPELADWCVVDLLAEDGALHRLATAHADPVKDDMLRELARLYPPDPAWGRPTIEVLHSGRPHVVTTVEVPFLEHVAHDAAHRRLQEELGCVSYMSVPLVARGRTLGVLSFMSARPSRRYSVADLPLAEELARRAALAVDNARLYKEVEDALRVRDDFLTAASHDLRTPLTSIKGRIELMQMRLDRGKELSDEFLRSQIGTLHKGAAHMLAVVDEITDVAHLQMGRQLALNRETFDVGELARAAAALVGGGDRVERATVVVTAGAETLVEGDRMRLARVLQNVIGNAVKYSPAATVVNVEVRDGTDAVRIVVRDHGVGIPADELPRIFTRFYRASTARGIDGTGIGLAGAKAIVEQHGGHITLESVVGEGVTVTITLPRVVAALEPLSSAIPEAM